MARQRNFYVWPEQVLGEIYGRTSGQAGMTEKRRDEVIAAAIFTCFRNQEFGTRFKLPGNYREEDRKRDAAGIDMMVVSDNGRIKGMQIKGIYLQRAIERRRRHGTKGVPRILSRRAQRFIKKDSAELTAMMDKELKKIIQDYSGLILLIHVIADLANQTSLEIAIRNSMEIVKHLKAREVWFMRNVPVRAIHGRGSKINCHAYQILKVAPDKRTYGFSFAL